MRKILNILIACEESQAICKEFRALGHNAFSCDIQECSGGHPEWHFRQDCLHVMQSGGGMKEDGVEYYIDGKWDLIIAHPPCTYLTVSGNRWFDVERYGEKAIQRAKDREEGAEFFMKFAKFDDCDHIAIENPIGIMSTRWRKADQIIQAYQFAHPYTKQTCLWLKNLPKLNPTDVLTKPESGWVNQSFTPDGRYGGFKNFNGSKERSKTFPGIAKAIAQQWSEYLLS